MISLYHDFLDLQHSTWKHRKYSNGSEDKCRARNTLKQDAFIAELIVDKAENDPRKGSKNLEV